MRQRHRETRASRGLSTGAVFEDLATTSSLAAVLRVCVGPAVGFQGRGAGRRSGQGLVAPQGGEPNTEEFWEDHYVFVFFTCGMLRGGSRAVVSGPEAWPDLGVHVQSGERVEDVLFRTWASSQVEVETMHRISNSEAPVWQPGFRRRRRMSSQLLAGTWDGSRCFAATTSASSS